MPPPQAKLNREKCKVVNLPKDDRPTTYEQIQPVPRGFGPALHDFLDFSLARAGRTPKGSTSGTSDCTDPVGRLKFENSVAAS